MPEVQYIKINTIIKKGQRESGGVYSAGRRLRFIGYPTDKNGKVAMTGAGISFQGMLRANPVEWFSVNDYSGKPLRITTNVGQLVTTPPGTPGPFPAVLPVGADGSLLVGIQMLILVSDSVEADDRSLDLYFE
jgi:hypothetical protein